MSPVCVYIVSSSQSPHEVIKLVFRHSALGLRSLFAAARLILKPAHTASLPQQGDSAFTTHSSGDSLLWTSPFLFAPSYTDGSHSNLVSRNSVVEARGLFVNQFPFLSPSQGRRAGRGQATVIGVKLNWVVSSTIYSPALRLDISA